MKYLICHLLCAVCLVSASLLRAQPFTTSATVFLKASDVKEGQEFSLSRATRWRFHAGDDTTGAWAKPEFDDSGWSSLSSLTRISDISNIQWSGKAWLRLTIICDSLLPATIATLCVSQDGATEIFWDGRLINKLGIEVV